MGWRHVQMVPREFQRKLKHPQFGTCLDHTLEPIRLLTRSVQPSLLYLAHQHKKDPSTPKIYCAYMLLSAIATKRRIRGFAEEKQVTRYGETIENRERNGKDGALGWPKSSHHLSSHIVQDLLRQR